ncbi:MAG: sulfotransferase domain-containing protein [Thermosphaera sp.]
MDLTNITRQYQKIAEDLLANNKPWEAIRFYTQALRIDNQNYHISNRLGEIFRDFIKDYEIAQVWFEHSFEIFPSPWPLDRIAEIQKDYLNDIQAAICWFKKAADLFPSNFWSCDRLGEIYRSTDEFDKAIEWFKESFERNPIPWPADRIAEIYRDHLHDYEKSAFWFKKAAECQPTNFWSCDRLAEIYHYFLYDDQEAIRWYEESYRRNQIPWPLERIAKIYRDHFQNYHEACRWFQLATIVDERNHWACDRLAEIYAYKLKDYQNAVGCFTESFRRKPNDFPLMQISYLLNDLNDQEGSMYWYEKAKELIGQKIKNIELNQAPSSVFRQEFDNNNEETTVYSDDLTRQENKETNIPQLTSKWSIITYNYSKNQACLRLEHNAQYKPIFIISIPKSGTYFIGKILTELGFVDCKVHLSEFVMEDKRFLPEKFVRKYPGRTTRNCPLEESTKLILPGQFAYGHIAYSFVHETVLQNFSKIFIYRNLRDILASYANYLTQIRGADINLIGNIVKRSGLEDKNRLLHYVLDEMDVHEVSYWQRIAKWRDVPDVFSVSYEELMGDYGREYQEQILVKLSEFLGKEIDPDVASHVLTQSIGKPTVTYSGKRSLWQEYWDDTIENLFVNMGFRDINVLLGYEK